MYFQLILFAAEFLIVSPQFRKYYTGLLSLYTFIFEIFLKICGIVAIYTFMF